MSWEYVSQDILDSKWQISAFHKGLTQRQEARWDDFEISSGLMSLQKNQDKQPPNFLKQFQVVVIQL